MVVCGTYTIYEYYVTTILDLLHISHRSRKSHDVRRVKRHKIIYFLFAHNFRNFVDFRVWVCVFSYVLQFACYSSLLSMLRAINENYYKLNCAHVVHYTVCILSPSSNSVRAQWKHVIDDENNPIVVQC